MFELDSVDVLRVIVQSIAVLSYLLFAFLILGTISSWLPQRWWISTLAIQFRRTFLRIAPVVGFLYLGAGEPFLLLALPFILVNLSGLVERRRPTDSVELIGDESTRIYYANVNVANRRADRIAETIDRLNPDVILLIETHPALAELLDRRLSGCYPNVSYHVYRDERFGIYYRSRLPIRRIITATDADGFRSPLIVEQGESEAAVRIVTMHPYSPERPSWVLRRNAYYLAVAEAIADMSGPILCLGDFNGVPWESPVREFFRRSKLTLSNSLLSTPITWPAAIRFLGIPIDLVGVKGGVSVSVRRGRGIGSDHLPLIIDYRTSPARQCETSQPATAMPKRADELDEV